MLPCWKSAELINHKQCNSSCLCKDVQGWQIYSGRSWDGALVGHREVAVRHVGRVLRCPGLREASGISRKHMLVHQQPPALRGGPLGMVLSTWQPVVQVSLCLWPLR